MDEASDDDGHFGWSDRCLRDEVIECLRRITVDEDGTDIVQRGFVRSLEIDSKRKVRFVLDTSKPDTDNFARRCEEELSRLAWIEEVEVTVNPSVYTPAANEDLDGIRNVILVTSCKGGVGKSTVAANLAVLFAQRGARVGICDLDIYGPSVPLLFPQVSGPVLMEDGLLKPLVTPSTPSSVGIQSSSVNESPYRNSSCFAGTLPRPLAHPLTSTLFRLPLEAPRPLKLMSSGFLRREHIAMKGPMACELAQQLLLNTAWGYLDYLIVDMPPGTGDLPLTIGEMVPSASYVLVTTPHDLSVADTLKGHMLFVEMGLECVGLVVNNMGVNRTGRVDRHGALVTNLPTVDESVDSLRQILGTKVAVCQTLNENQEMTIREFYTESKDKTAKEEGPIGPIALAWYHGVGWTTSLINLKRLSEEIAILLSERKAVDHADDKPTLPSVVFESCHEMVVKMGSKSCRLSAMKLRRSCKCADCVVDLPKFTADDAALKSIISVTPKGMHVEFQDGHKAYLRFEHVLPDNMKVTQPNNHNTEGVQADW